MSTNLVDQLHVKREELDAPLGLQLVVQGSRSKINLRAQCRFQYQSIDEERQFDVINLSNYDLILGTPWMYQHQVCLGFNPARVVIGTDTALPIEKGVDTKLMVHAIDVDNGDFEASGDLPTLAGLEVCAAVHRRPRTINPRTEKGRSETSRGFVARRVYDNFVLRGPVERKEGEGTSQNTENPKTLPLYEPRLTIRIKPAVVKNSSPPEMDGVASKNSSSNAALSELVSSSQGGNDLLFEIRKNYHKDPIFDLILKKPSKYRNFEVDNGLVYLKERESRLLYIPKVLINGLSAREIIISEAHSRLTHLGVSKTLDYLRNQVWWKNMISDTKSFCETCMTCKCRMDFVGPLHESSNRNRTHHPITAVISLLRYSIHPGSPKPPAYHSNLYRISDILFITTDIFPLPVQHHTYPVAVIYACLTHEVAVRDDVTMKDEPGFINFDFLARVFNSVARGTKRFAYFVNAPSNPAVINKDRTQPDDWNTTPPQRGITIENPIFPQLVENDVARNLRCKATIPSQIEKYQSFRSHSDVIKFAATYRTKVDTKLKGTKNALVSTPITSFVSRPIITTSLSVASHSAATLEVTIPVISTSSSTDISMTGPIDPFILPNAEMLAAFIEDTPFDNDTILFDSLLDITI